MAEDPSCSEHSGLCAKIESLEDNVSKLWDKWDSMQKLVIGTLVTSMISAIGIIGMLIKSVLA